MKMVWSMACIAVMSFTQHAFAETNSKDIEIAISQVTKMGIDLSKFPDAKAELIEQVGLCGPGVVESFTGENRCTHQIRIDDWFLKPLTEKTGYIYEESWPWQDGVEFMEAPDDEDPPLAWDLADVGPMTDIHTQQCGDCWSTSSRKLLEQALATHGVVDENEELVQLSAQTTLSSCCRSCGSCSGGYMSTPNFFTTDDNSSWGYGLPTRDQDPYYGSNTSCRFSTNELRDMSAKLVSSPYVGSSLAYSRYFRADERSGPKVQNTKTLMHKYKSNALVTIAAISSSGGVITSCSSINSGGNHMQNIVGWYEQDGETIARVQNSWGTSHGQDGYTHIKWECGDNRYNRGLGVSTRVGIYETEGVCSQVAKADTGPDKIFIKTSKNDSVILGQPSKGKQTCQWLPKEGIQEVLSADGCQVRVSPDVTTEYHLSARESTCRTKVSSMVLVTPTSPSGTKLSGQIVLTPHGAVEM